MSIDKKEDRKLKGFKLPSDLITRFEETCNDRKVSEQDGAETALKEWIDGRRKTDKSLETMREIVNQYEGKTCSKCGNPILKGASCWWARGAGLTCQACHSQAELDSQSDQQLVRKDLVLQSLNQRIAVAKKLYGFLLQRINKFMTLEAVPELRIIEQEAAEAKAEGWRTFLDYQRSGIGHNERDLFRKMTESLARFDLIIQNCQQKIREINMNPKLTRSLKELLMEAEALPEITASEISK